MKVSVFVSFLFLLIVAELQLCSCDDERNVPMVDYLFGKRIRHDITLKEWKVVEMEPAAKFWLFERTNELELYYKAKAEDQKISAIEVTQMEATRPSIRPKYADVEILNGGINETSVTLKLESQKGNGFSYTVKIFGLPRPGSDVVKTAGTIKNNIKEKKFTRQPRH